MYSYFEDVFKCAFLKSVEARHGKGFEGLLKRYF